MYVLLFRTDAGLRIRAVTQNRGMAACLGVRSRRVDALTFALGAGLAGLAGCALTQIGNVGPELGQNYIVDSFMVVVTGGVGKLAGTILAAAGIGGLNKVIEPGLGAVFGKVAILVAAEVDPVEFAAGLLGPARDHECVSMAACRLESVAVAARSVVPVAAFRHDPFQAELACPRIDVAAVRLQMLAVEDGGRHILQQLGQLFRVDLETLLFRMSIIVSAMTTGILYSSSCVTR